MDNKLVKTQEWQAKHEKRTAWNIWGLAEVLNTSSCFSAKAIMLKEYPIICKENRDGNLALFTICDSGDYETEDIDFDGLLQCLKAQLNFSESYLNEQN